MKVRLGRRSDVKRVAELLNSSEHLRLFPDSCFCEVFVRTHLTNPLNILIVCEDGGKVIGAVTGEIWRDKSYGFISTIIVDKNARAAGCGSAMLDFFEDVCRKRGVRSVNFLVKTSNRRMAEWSRRKGFRQGASLHFFEKSLDVAGKKKK